MENIIQKYRIEQQGTLFFITEDNITPHCHYRNKNQASVVMSSEIMRAGIEFAKKNSLVSVFLGDQNQRLEDIYEDGIYILGAQVKDIPGNAVLVYDNSVNMVRNDGNMCILLISRENIEKIYGFIKKLSIQYERITLIKMDIAAWEQEDLENYKQQLRRVEDLILQSYRDRKKLYVNILTDRIELNAMCNCRAGEYNFALAPNGKFYICPSFYFDNPKNYIGDLEHGINNKMNKVLRLEDSPICSTGCDVYHCDRCKYLNYTFSGMYNMPNDKQCIISYAERQATRELQEKLINQGFNLKQNLIDDISYIDFLEKIVI